MPTKNGMPHTAVLNHYVTKNSITGVLMVTTPLVILVSRTPRVKRIAQLMTTASLLTGNNLPTTMPTVAYNTSGRMKFTTIPRASMTVGITTNVAMIVTKVLMVLSLTLA